MTLAGFDLGPASVRQVHTLSRRQSRNVMSDGTPRVRNLSAEEEFIDVTWSRMSQAQWDLLQGIIIGLGYAESTTTMIDGYSVSRTVRYWGKSLAAKRRLGRFWSTTVRFRVES